MDAFLSAEKLRYPLRNILLAIMLFCIVLGLYRSHVTREHRKDAAEEFLSERGITWIDDNGKSVLLLYTPNPNTKEVLDALSYFPLPDEIHVDLLPKDRELLASGSETTVFAFLEGRNLNKLCVSTDQELVNGEPLLQEPLLEESLLKVNCTTDYFELFGGYAEKILPWLAGQDQLTELALYEDKSTSIAITQPDFGNLRELMIECYAYMDGDVKISINRLDSLQLACVRAADSTSLDIACNPVLKHLEVSFFSSRHTHIAISDCPELTYVKIENSLLTPDFVNTLAEIDSLNHLHLQYIRHETVNGEGIVFDKLRSLKSLKLHSCSLSQSSVDSLIKLSEAGVEVKLTDVTKRFTDEEVIIQGNKGGSKRKGQ